MRKINKELISEIRGRGLYQKEIARKAGLSEAVMSMIIRGKYIPDNVQKVKIADALDVEPDKIFKRDNV